MHARLGQLAHTIFSRHRNTPYKKGVVAQMPLAEDDDMIKAFPPDRANQPFRMSILPWRAGRGWAITNAHGREAAG
jgi:hypothetical protein